MEIYPGKVIVKGQLFCNIRGKVMNLALCPLPFAFFLIAVYLPQSLNSPGVMPQKKIYQKINNSAYRQGRAMNLALCTFSHCHLSPYKISRQYLAKLWTHAPDESISYGRKDARTGGCMDRNRFSYRLPLFGGGIKFKHD